MPTEKNAAFLPTQYSFKLDRQRVNVDLKSLVSFDKTLIFEGKWLYILLLEYSTLFWTNVKFVEGKCKLWLQVVVETCIQIMNFRIGLK